MPTVDCRYTINDRRRHPSRRGISHWSCLCQLPSSAKPSAPHLDSPQLHHGDLYHRATPQRQRWHRYLDTGQVSWRMI